MKRKSILLLAGAIALSVFGGCVSTVLDTSSETKESYTQQSEDKSQQKATVNPTKLQTPKFDLSSIPEYSGNPYVEINDNEPYFSDDEYTTSPFEYYSDLDTLGRCGMAYACVGKDIMPTEERGSIGSVKPSGWQTVKYDCVDGNYLYNRCHLIGYQLTGENANEKNLITGTRYLNVDGMLPFENMVADYVKETDNHTLYRVTPIFKDDELVARGVLMEAKSVEDNGDSITFCVYCYNVQPDIKIDYKTGESEYTVPTTKEEPKIEFKVESRAESKAESHYEEPEESPKNENTDTHTYILNTNTKKFHYPDCSAVKRMKDSNKEEFTGTRDEVISRGYDPCQKCFP